MSVFTLFFDGQFWVGVLEVDDAQGLVHAVRHVFGPRPSDAELAGYLQEHGCALIDTALASPPVPPQQRNEGRPPRRSPKRAARQAAREAARPQPSTAAQLALSAARQESRRQSRAEARRRHREDADAAWRRRRERARRRHRGH